MVNVAELKQGLLVKKNNIVVSAKSTTLIISVCLKASAGRPQPAQQSKVFHKQNNENNEALKKLNSSLY